MSVGDDRADVGAGQRLAVLGEAVGGTAVAVMSRLGASHHVCIP
ncbi:hypothetical protein [Streptomyces rapamycinicus]|uniref:Uncharacterized protein n=1 Tax=Streptomyces rapamycinicus TaxID=1226757 RepID=A0ABR6LYP9_9ACTN|nr:hypothetical protein [Streptomyces rapamycinicus]AGP61336.1 hypothetical protein M271_49875 [Streptomyces rapamycinicus NRRL 5491]MBB4787480.1 hypothetical protein [Streptomyces rapamycinicus]